MSRLLFAAARGAQIEALDPNLGWRLSSHVPLSLSNDKRPYRIHPEDAHLQYGPISSKLRDMAEYGQEALYGSIPMLVIDALVATDLNSSWSRTWSNQTPDERRLALCVMAEALADLGC